MVGKTMGYGMQFAANQVQTARSYEIYGVMGYQRYGRTPESA